MLAGRLFRKASQSGRFPVCLSPSRSGRKREITKDSFQSKGRRLRNMSASPQSVACLGYPVGFPLWQEEGRSGGLPSARQPGARKGQARCTGKARSVAAHQVSRAAKVAGAGTAFRRAVSLGENCRPQGFPKRRLGQRSLMVKGRFRAGQPRAPGARHQS